MLGAHLLLSAPRQMQTFAPQRSASRWAGPASRRARQALACASSSAAGHRQRRTENVQGPVWVDSTCIDCDTCRWMAPATFSRANGMSAVHKQPEGRAARVQAMKALLSCPTYSIHMDDRTREELQEGQQGLPALVEDVPGVFHCGWASEKSFAAAAYLIVRPPEQGGNILVDSPRYNPVLARQIEALGGVKYLFLTHKDDVADHEQWAKHFGAQRILHQGEVTKGTQGVEIQLQGEGPWVLPASPGAVPVPVDQAGAQHDITLILTPGHTRAHVCLYHAPTSTLFSGDHLSSPSDVDRPHDLEVFRDFNWYDFDTQMASVLKLLEYPWTTVLPGHGRRAYLKTLEHRARAIEALFEEHGKQSLLQQHQDLLQRSRAASVPASN